MNVHKDFIICGGGLVGSALACAIASSPILNSFTTLLLESGKPKKAFSESSPYSNRVSAISLTTQQLFNEIGVWDEIKKRRLASVTKMKIWTDSSNLTTFNTSDGASELAYIVENDVVIGAMEERLRDSKNVEVMYNVCVDNCSLPSENGIQPCVELLNDAQSYSCDLLVGADGANSKVRKAMNHQYLSWNYDQHAIVATLEIAASEESLNETAWQKFLPTGPVALLPLNKTLSSLVWTNTPENARTLLSLSDECFVDSLNTALWSEKESDPIVENVSRKIGQFLETVVGKKNNEEIDPPTVKSVKSGSRAAFPLALGHATKYAERNVALVGDAAHKVHPLAGQGVNIGFGDVKCLVSSLENAVLNGEKIGSLPALLDYERSRLRYNVPRIFGIDLIHRMTANNLAPCAIITNIALQLTQSVPSLNKLVIHAAK